MKKLLLLLCLLFHLSGMAQEALYTLRFDEVMFPGMKNAVKGVGKLTIYADRTVVFYAKTSNKSFNKSFEMRSASSVLDGFYFVLYSYNGEHDRKIVEPHVILSENLDYIIYNDKRNPNKEILVSLKKARPGNKEEIIRLMDDFENINTVLFSNFVKPPSELPLKFDGTIKMKKDKEDGYYLAQASHYAREYVIGVYTNTGKYLDDTDYEDYDLKLDYVIDDGWLTIVGTGPRFVVIRLDPLAGTHSRIAQLNFSIRGKKVGQVSVIQLAEGVNMGW